ncbi:hypothetical protein OTU49_015067, partial [Cherax quadricarinatus]
RSRPLIPPSADLYFVNTSCNMSSLLLQAVLVAAVTLLVQADHKGQIGHHTTRVPVQANYGGGSGHHATRVPVQANYGGGSGHHATRLPVQANFKGYGGYGGHRTVHGYGQGCPTLVEHIVTTQ